MENMQMHINADEETFVDDYLLYLLARASAVASASFHDELANLGVPVAKWRVLACLFPDKALNVGDLARKCLAKQSTLSRQLDALVAEGLILRKNAKTDRRGVVVHLTDAGRTLTADLIDRAKHHEMGMLKKHKTKNVHALKRLLQDIVNETEDTT